MAKNPKVIVLRTAGTNCDAEAGFAFQASGAQVDLVHVNELVKKTKAIRDYHILVFPGGFSYGDDIESGKILANELNAKLRADIRRFIDDKKLIIGICNGFQVLVKAGILPGLHPEGDIEFRQQATLTFNDSGKFEDRWGYLKVSGKSVWTEGLDPILYLPVAHGEGKFVCDQRMLDNIRENNQVAFRYVRKDGTAPEYPANPNGALDHIAGITDPTGLILGLMPHPERHFLFTQHPSWTRFSETKKFGDGAKIFQNAVEYVKGKF